MSLILWWKQIIKFLAEVKGKDRLYTSDVLSKKDKSINFCKIMPKYAKLNTHKKWRYLLIPSQQIHVNTTSMNLVHRVEIK